MKPATALVLALVLVLALAAPARADGPHLLGVDATGAHAYVLRGDAIDTVAVAGGKVTATTRGDLAASVAIVARTGVWSARWFEVGFEPTAHGVALEQDGDLVLARRDGAEAVAVDHGVSHPRVAPDGTRVAWEVDRIGPHHALRVAAARAGAPQRTVALTELYSVWQWTPDGTAILGYQMVGCLERFDADTLAVTELACDLSDAVMDATGKTMALTTTDGDIRWIDAASGHELGRAAPSWWNRSASGFMGQLLSPRGLYVTTSRDHDALLVVDLASGHVATIDAGRGHVFEGLGATRWLGESIVVLEGKGDRMTPRRIDVRAALP